jgi:hypothetical protein
MPYGGGGGFPPFSFLGLFIQTCGGVCRSNAYLFVSHNLGVESNGALAGVCAQGWGVGFCITICVWLLFFARHVPAPCVETIMGCIGGRG